MLFEEQIVDLMMKSGPEFKPYVKNILPLLDNKQVVLTTLIDTGVVASIIYGNCDANPTIKLSNPHLICSFNFPRKF